MPISAREPPTSEGRVAVLDIGKTNIKLSAVSADGHVLESLSRPNEVREGPPWRHHDLAGIGDWAFSSLGDLGRRHPIRHIVASGHGSGGVLVVDDPDYQGDGAALPMIDYEQAVPDGLNAAYLPLAGSFLDRGSSVMMAATHQARQLLWMQRADPAAFGRARWFLNISQYWAFRLSGVAVHDYSLLGAQSHFWNVAEGRYAPIVNACGWERLMPRIVPAYDDLGPIRPALVARYGLPDGIRVHAGVHDSSGNVYRYRAAGLSDAMVVSTGTWIVALASDIAIDRLEESAGMTLNADIEGRPVGGALTMGGREFTAVAGAQPAGARADPAMIARLVRDRVMAIPSFGSNDGQYPGSAGRGHIQGPMPEGPEARLALAVLYAALLTLSCIDRLDPGRNVVLDGSFLRDPSYAALVAALRPMAKTVFSRESYGVAAGTALLCGHLTRRRPVEISLETPMRLNLEGLADYAAAWQAAARANMTSETSRRSQTI